MRLNEPEKQILDDFEHKVTNRIELYGDRPDFPKIENYDITRQDLDGYLFDKQAILDTGGSKRTQYTVLGISCILPVLILDCMQEESRPFGEYAPVAGVLFGVLFALFLNSLRKMYIAVRIRKHKDIKFEKYINAVLFYKPQV